MRNNEDAERELAPDRLWWTAYALVEHAAVAILGKLLPGDRMNTAELVFFIYNGRNSQVRDRVFKALQAAATRGLSQYVTRGKPEKIGSVEGARRLWWHRPIEGTSVKLTCPKCKREL